MSPVDVAAAFLAALRHRDEAALWQMFSSRARGRVIDVGERRGLPADLAARLRIGTASAAEEEDFRVDVLEGVLHDLRHADLFRIVPKVEEVDESTARLVLEEELPVVTGPPLPPVPAGWLELIKEDGWAVERLIPAVRT